MKVILVSGPSSLVMAASQELVNREIHEKKNDLFFKKEENKTLLLVNLSLEKYEFPDEKDERVFNFPESSPDFFALPGEWNEFISAVDKFSEELVTQELANTFDPAGLIFELDDETLDFLVACPKCGGYHVRHAGYMTTKFGYKSLDERGGAVSMSEAPVHVCVNCKTPRIHVGSKTYDVSKYFDLAAWERTEIEAHKATGPGGQC